MSVRLSRQNGRSTIRRTSSQPDKKPGHVRQCVPTNGERAELDRNRVDLRKRQDEERQGATFAYGGGHSPALGPA